MLEPKYFIGVTSMEEDGTVGGKVFGPTNTPVRDLETRGWRRLDASQGLNTFELADSVSHRFLGRAVVGTAPTSPSSNISPINELPSS